MLSDPLLPSLPHPSRQPHDHPRHPLRVTDRHTTPSSHQLISVVIEEEQSTSNSDSCSDDDLRPDQLARGGGAAAAAGRSRRNSSASDRGDEAADTYRVCVFNLSKVVLGAGMMAMPKAIYMLGVIPGTVFFVIIGWLTHYTLARGLVYTTDALGGPSKSYSGLVRSLLGGKAEAVLQLSVFTT